MVYQIAIEMERKKFTISESSLRDAVSWIYTILWIVSFIEVCIVVFVTGLLILAVLGFGVFDKIFELLLWVTCVFVWTLIPCLVYGIIEQDLMIPTNCVYEDRPNPNNIYRDTKRSKKRGGYHYVT